MAGLGNIYADEALFQAGALPGALALDQARLEGLFSCIRKVLETAVACQSPTCCRIASQRCPRDWALLGQEKIGGRTSCYFPQQSEGVEPTNVEEFSNTSECMYAIACPPGP